MLTPSRWESVGVHDKALPQAAELWALQARPKKEAGKLCVAGTFGIHREKRQLWGGQGT